MKSFYEQVKASVERTLKKIDTACYRISKKLFYQVIYNAPVLRGNLVNDFWVASNSYDTRRLTTGAINAYSDVTGSGSMARVDNAAFSKTFYRKDGFLSMSNSVDYAYEIEYLGHSPTKAPMGFLRNALTKVAAEVRQGNID